MGFVRRGFFASWEESRFAFALAPSNISPAKIPAKQKPQIIERPTSVTTKTLFSSSYGRFVVNSEAIVEGKTIFNGGMSAISPSAYLSAYSAISPDERNYKGFRAAGPRNPNPFSNKKGPPESGSPQDLEFDRELYHCPHARVK